MYRARQQQQQQSLRQAEPLRTGVGYATELAGRDRAKFFRCPVEPHDAALLLPQQPHQQQQQQQQEEKGEVQQLQSRTHYTSDGEVRSTSSFVLHFASTCPTANASSSSHARTWRSRRARAHHLPTLSRVSAAQDGNSNNNNNSRHATCDVAQQTDYRESEAQTEPYTPDYYIPDGAPAEPEILQLAGLRWRDGLPAGQEEVDLLARLRRRRAVEAALPPPPSQRGGDDKDAAAAAMTRRYAMLHALEEQEWREREEHVARVQQRRLDAMAASLEAREQAAEALMQQRLAHMQQQRTDALRDQLARLEARRLADARRGVDQHIRIAATAAAASAARPGVSGASMSAQMAKAMTMPHAAAAMTTTTPPSKADLIASYVKYGSAAAPPVVHGSLPCRRTDTSHDDDDDNKSNDSTTMPRHTTTTTTTAAAVVTTPVMYTRRRDYDVRPMLLGSVAGAAEVGEARATHLDATAFAVPVDAAVRRLSTLHKRRDAERLLRALDYAQAAIDRRKRRGRDGAATARRRRRDGDDKATTSVAAAADDSDSARRRRHAARENKNDSDSDDDSVAEAVAAMQARSDDKNDDDNDDTNASRQRVRVLDLYRATPRIARPDTPVLELDGDADEDKDEACLLLQRLLRGRAVQNTYYEGKERCRGLIAELQAASNAQYAERSLVDAHERHEMAMRQDAMVQSVLDAAEGGLVADALASLFHERTRQAEARRLAAQRAVAERARGVREADEQARRARECVARARAEVQYAACVRATDATVMCFLQDTFLAAVDEAALRDATAHEHARRVARQQQEQEQQQQPDSVHAREAVVCDMLDDFVVPTVVRTLEQAGQRQHAQAPACAVLALAARGFVADDVDDGDNNDGSGGDKQSA